MRLRLRLITLVALGAIGGTSAIAPTASASSSAQKAFWGPLNLSGRPVFPIYRDLGVGIIQTSLEWSQTAPTKPRNPTNPNDPAYHWSPEVGAILQQATLYHMKLVVQILTTPPWANGNRPNNYPPNRPSDLANFVTAVARKYPSVHLWMIWGEANRAENWGSIVAAPRTATRLTPAQAAAPRLYARMLDASYGALKKLSKRNLVIGGDTYTFGYINTAMWIKYMRLPNGKPPRIDLYAHDPFSWRDPNLRNPQNDPANRVYAWEYDFSDMGRLYKLVNKHFARRHQHIKLFISEFCIPTAPNDIEFGFWTTPQVAAKWTTDALKIVRHTNYFYALSWIHLFDDPPGGSNSGLFFNNGIAKPGYYAFKAG